MQPSSQEVGLYEKFPKKTSTDESKREMLMDDCNHMNEATNMGWGGVCPKILQNSFKNRSTLSL